MNDITIEKLKKAKDDLEVKQLSSFVNNFAGLPILPLPDGMVPLGGDMAVIVSESLYAKLKQHIKEQEL